MTDWRPTSKTGRDLDGDESGTGEAMRRHLEAIREEVQVEREYAKTYDGQMEYIAKEIAGLRYDQIDSGADHSARIAELEARRDALHAEHQAEADAAFAAEWTREVTVERRATWNAMVRAGKFTRNGKIWMPLVREQERAQGWYIDSLKKAVALHNL